ncbi:MAG: hypothetical protein SPF51_10200 [Candidatus Fimivicinus sp.]|nr:hypothetical protein [Candidatus Fimivicinus sp.]
MTEIVKNRHWMQSLKSGVVREYSSDQCQRFQRCFIALRDI